MNTEQAAAPEGSQHCYAELSQTRLHYVIGGEGPAVLLLHGWPQTWYGWRKAMVPLAAAGHTVIALDNRGFGDSSRADGGFDRKAMAEDVFQFVRSLGLASLAVIGHDWGGSIAYTFAATHPELVSRLAMIEGVPFGPWVFEAPSWKTAPVAHKGWFNSFHQIAGLPETLTLGREREYLGYFYREFSSAAEQIAEADIAEFLRSYSDPKVMKAGFELYRAIPLDVAHNFTLAKTPLAMPVLALGGEICFAGVVQEVMEKLATNVTGGVIAGANHWIPEEQTEELLARLVDFL